MSVDYSMLPEHMQDGARLYVEKGIAPGGFMMAVLCNDLCGAAARADEVNRRLLHEWAAWIYNELPGSAWGSPEKVAAWMARGGSGNRTHTRTPQQEQELDVMRSRGDL